MKNRDNFFSFSHVWLSLDEALGEEWSHVQDDGEIMKQESCFHVDESVISIKIDHADGTDQALLIIGLWWMVVLKRSRFMADVEWRGSLGWFLLLRESWLTPRESKKNTWAFLRSSSIFHPKVISYIRKREEKKVKRHHHDHCSHENSLIYQGTIGVDKRSPMICCDSHRTLDFQVISAHGRSCFASPKKTIRAREN